MTFREIDDIDFYRPLKVTPHTEHEPLCLPLAIGVIPYPDIVRFLFSLSHLFNICTLKVAVKKDLLLSGKFIGASDVGIFDIG